jgi:RNA polymerase sigma factor (sigma-70 family)
LILYSNHLGLKVVSFPRRRHLPLAGVLAGDDPAFDFGDLGPTTPPFPTNDQIPACNRNYSQVQSLAHAHHTFGAAVFRFFARFCPNRGTTFHGSFGMAQWPATRLTLLDRLRDNQNQSAGEEFIALYGPLVCGFTRKRLPQDEDAADVMQEVLGAVAKGSYDPEKGPFRKWLLTVLLNEIRDFFSRRQRLPEILGTVAADLALEELPAKIEDEWDHDHRQRLFERAAEIVQGRSNPVHWQAFWLTAVDDMSGKEVAEALTMSVANVYSAKSRILEEIKRTISEFE